MILLISKFVRSLNTYQYTKMPKKCYAFFYLPASNNEVCDCVNHCKYQPPGKGLKYKIETIIIQDKSIYAH